MAIHTRTCSSCNGEGSNPYPCFKCNGTGKVILMRGERWGDHKKNDWMITCAIVCFALSILILIYWWLG